MKLHSLIPSLVLGAALAASAQTAAPGQPPQSKPTGLTLTITSATSVLSNTAENGPLHNLRLQPGTLKEVVEQLQAACTRATAENPGRREAAEENLRKARAHVEEVQKKGAEDIELMNKAVSKEQALAEEAKAAAKGKDATVRAKAELDQADSAYQRLVRATKANPNIVAQQDIDDAKAKRDAAAGVLDTLREETAKMELAEANVSRAQEFLAQAQARAGAEMNAAGEEQARALDAVKRYQMPMVTYAPGVSEVKISAALDLADMRPLDALALIAAAGGCDLFPVYTPDSEDTGQRVIGYCFEFNPNHHASGGAASNSGTGSHSLAISPDGGTIFSSQSTSAKDPLESVPKPLPQAAPLMPPPPGSSGGGSPKPAAGSSAAGSYTFDLTTGQVLGGSSSSPVILPAIDMNAQVVRIYAVGPILDGDGREEERERAKAKEDAFKDLILEALGLAQASGPPEPKLYFHGKSGVLIAKATLRQQEIIEQAVSAMKENDRFVNPSQGNALPQAKPPKP